MQGSSHLSSVNNPFHSKQFHYFLFYMLLNVVSNVKKELSVVVAAYEYSTGLFSFLTGSSILVISYALPS